ncbi:nitrate reductase molybdenum cofactor assembly chaperone [Propionibacteriaceae bacterium G57]|uniref:nitrate reductase molybdenum cofactor assembly chaperone n=1 Tax=Aestuariimicrobium sp. G57 TaxID=3418485 RepID=UPI003DA78681
MSPLAPMEWLGRLKRREPSAQAASGVRHYGEPTLDDATLRGVWQVCSLLLGYPDDRLLGLLPAIRRSIARFPDEAAGPLLGLVKHLESTPMSPLRTAYVETFDTTRKCALHLTYYAHGDTRKRGIALVQFKQAFRRAGLEVTEDELPDHLAVVLEFGATGDVAVAWKLLNDHRAGIELLQWGLDAKSSPWAGVVTALRTTLPPLDGGQEEAVRKLLADGPPDEEVGLDGYSIDPLLNPHPNDDQLLLESLGDPR